MIKKRINQLIKKFNKYDIDGYIIPKNDEFFSEYSAIDRLKAISNFKTREKDPVGVSVTLRRRNMYEFLERFINHP